MAINNGAHTTRRHRLLQPFGAPACKAETTWWDRSGNYDGAEGIVSIINIETGCARLQIDISPAEARELAASLVQQADEVEAAQRQLEQEAVSA